jgi:DHA1 family tetracycline resistance protein-like MFS transporter
MVTGLIGPALFSETFATFINTRRTWQLPGAPYLLSSLLLVIGLLLAVHVTKPAATI